MSLLTPIIHTIGDESLVSRPERFTPYVRAPNNHYTGGRVSPWNILGLLSIRKPFSCQQTDKVSSVFQSVAKWLHLFKL